MALLLNSIRSIFIAIFIFHSDVKRIDVVLRSGDMLVLPPFWYHRVETLKSSVSVNVSNDAPEYLLMEEMSVITSERFSLI